MGSRKPKAVEPAELGIRERVLVPFFSTEDLPLSQPQRVGDVGSHTVEVREFGADGYFSDPVPYRIISPGPPTSKPASSGSKKKTKSAKKVAAAAEVVMDPIRFTTPKKPKQPKQKTPQKQQGSSLGGSGDSFYADPEFLAAVPDPSGIPMPSFLGQVLARLQQETKPPQPPVDVDLGSATRTALLLQPSEVKATSHRSSSADPENSKGLGSRRSTGKVLILPSDLT